MTVYIDVLFLRELVFDAILLSVTAWILKLKWTWWKVTLAASVGALYTIALLFPSLSFLFHFSLKLLVSCIMLCIAFGFIHWRQYVKRMIVFYLMSFLAGGVTTGLYYMFLPTANAFWKQVLLMNDSFYMVIQTSFIYILLAFGVAAYLIVKTVVIRKKQHILQENLVNVNIVIAGKEINSRALIDTGNQLYDPFGRTPVVIAEANMLAEFFPDLMAALKSTQSSYYDISHLSDELLDIWQTKIKIIPFRSVNKDGQFIVALKPEQLSFVHNDVTYTSEKVLLGLDFGQLSRDKQYEIILHPALIENVN